jgi:hypothetical protein
MAINIRGGAGGGGRVVVPPPAPTRSRVTPVVVPAPPAHAIVVQPPPVAHQAILQYPIIPPNLTPNQKVVWDIAEVLGVPPVTIGQDYLDTCNKVAALLGVPSAAAQNTMKVAQLTQNVSIQPLLSISRALPIAAGMSFPYVNVAAPVFSLSHPTDVNNSVGIRNGALQARNNVFDFVNRVSSFIAQATNQGLAPPDNPFVFISNLQAARETRARTLGNSGLGLDVSTTDADTLVFNIGAYVDLLTAQSQGKLDLTKTTNVAAQINSFTLSMDGYGSGGHTATDLMRFLPSADEIRAQKDLELLAAFDFKKRQPKVVFTADYQPGEWLEGMVIGWKKIPDASGYILKRRGVFDQTEKSIQVSNKDLQTSMDHLRDYLNAHILTFYDTIDHNQVWAYLDNSTAPDQLYLYTVQAYQIQNDAKDQLFQVPLNPSNLSSPARAKVLSTLTQLAHQYYGPGASADDINPWPIISLQLFGNSQFDWILAAVNGRASTNRHDSNADTRRFSYLGARLSHLLDFMDRGLFVAPKNINDAVKAVTESVNNFGVSQTIAEILHETGILYYFEGTEHPKPSGLNRAGTLNVGVSPLLSGIISAIDPETATLDLKTLGSNLPSLLHNGGLLTDRASITGLKLGHSGGNPNVHATPQEINVPDPSVTNDEVTQGDVQFLNQLPATADSVIDLTTYSGLSDLTRTIRLFADEGPNRGGGDTVAQGVSQPAPPRAEVYIPPPPPHSVFVPPSKVSGIPVAPPAPRTVVPAPAPRPRRLTRVLPDE